MTIQISIKIGWFGPRIEHKYGKKWDFFSILLSYSQFTELKSVRTRRAQLDTRN